MVKSVFFVVNHGLHYSSMGVKTGYVPHRTSMKGTEKRDTLVVKNGITDSMGDHPNIFMAYQWDLMGCFLVKGIENRP